MCTFNKTYLTVHIKNRHFIVCNLYLNNTNKNEGRIKNFSEMQMLKESIAELYYKNSKKNLIYLGKIFYAI